MKGAFITATGTGVGKTWLASALAHACVQRGKRVAAIKPIETGVDPDPLSEAMLTTPPAPGTAVSTAKVAPAYANV